MNPKRIEITSTGIQITPYHKNQCPYLEKLTSTYDAVRHRRNPVTGFFLDYDSTDPCFVTHMHQSKFIQSNFPDYSIRYIPPTKGYPLLGHFQLNPEIIPRDVQTDIINQIVNDPKHNDWFVYLSQGLGKTLLSVYLISYFNTKTLIMCYNKDILHQWFTTMRDKTNIDPQRIIIIDSSKIFEKILEKDFPTEDFDIFMCTPGLLSSFGKKNGFQNLLKLFDLCFCIEV